uniref:Retroviral polymerase SH3-like domain-containing protein n=1 Tax=Salix viminalis TaxID=40686 RepID=A0A6N2LWI3_SALVM
MAQTLKCINGFKYQRRCRKLTLGLATKRLRDLKMRLASAKARPYRHNEKKLDSRMISYYFIEYSKRFRRYKFYDPTTKSIFKMGNARFFENVEFYWRVIMVLVAHFNLELYQMDVNTVFLNGNIDEMIYMMQPKTFVSRDPKNMELTIGKQLNGFCGTYKEKKDYMLTYQSLAKLEIIGYSDSYFAGSQDSMKFMLGYIYMIVGGVVSTMRCKFKLAILYSSNNRSSSKSKHIDIKFLAVNERV